MLQLLYQPLIAVHVLTKNTNSNVLKPSTSTDVSAQVYAHRSYESRESIDLVIKFVLGLRPRRIVNFVNPSFTHKYRATQEKQKNDILFL